MRLLVDCHCFDYPTPQGINTYLRGLYCALIPMAPDIEFYLAANNVAILKKIFGERPNIHYVQIPHKGSLSRLLSVFPNAIKENKIDVAHFQYVAPFRKHCKTVVTLHDILFLDFPQYFPLSYRISKGLLFKHSAKNADLLLTVSEYSKRQIALHYKIADSKIKVTENAVLDRFSSITKNEAQAYVRQKYNLDRYILYVSRLEPRKDQYGLIKAYFGSGLFNDGIKLAIVGEESIKDPRITELLSSQPEDATAHIAFLNGVLDDALTNLYKAASLFVYPSKAEGFGIPPLEAATAEVPTICNNATAMGDFECLSPRLTDTSNTTHLAKMMRDVLSDTPSADELKAIKDKVMKRYNWESIASYYLEALKTF